MYDFAVIIGILCQRLPDHGVGPARRKGPSQKGLSIFIIGYQLHEARIFARFAHYMYPVWDGVLGTQTLSVSQCWLNEWLAFCHLPLPPCSCLLPPSTQLCAYFWTLSVFFQKLPVLPNGCSNLTSCLETDILLCKQFSVFLLLGICKATGVFCILYVKPTAIPVVDFLMLGQDCGGAWGGVGGGDSGDQHKTLLKLH